MKRTDFNSVRLWGLESFKRPSQILKCRRGAAWKVFKTGNVIVFPTTILQQCGSGPGNVCGHTVIRSDCVITLTGKVPGPSPGATLKKITFSFTELWKPITRSAPTCHHRSFPLITRLKTFEKGVMSTCVHFEHETIWRRPTSLNMLARRGNRWGTTRSWFR